MLFNPPNFDWLIGNGRGTSLAEDGRQTDTRNFINARTTKMLGLFFLFLGIVAAKISLWQTGLLAMVFATSAPPDPVVGAISFAAAFIFFGLWLASRADGEKSKSRSLFFD